MSKATKTGTEEIAVRVISPPILVILLALTIGFVADGCWKKQKHEITAPETPVYTVFGTVRDRDTGVIMRSVEVVLSAAELVYDYDFVSAADTTDQTGRYEFEEMISPGMYQLTVFREGFPVFDKQVVVEHKDKECDIDMPMPLVAKFDYPYSAYPVCYGFRGFQGIYWRYSQALAGITFYKPDKYTAGGTAVIVGNFAGGFELVGQAKYIRDNPEFHGLAYLSNYWAAWDSGATSKIVSIDPARGNIDGETDVQYRIVDLTSDSTSLWGTAEIGKIVQFGQHPSVVVQVYDTEIGNPGGIAWDGKYIWTSDNIEGMVFKHGSDLSVVESYKSFYWDSFAAEYRPLSLTYLAFDTKGNLWGGDGPSLYEFRM